jgi:hypothetical protein
MKHYTKQKGTEKIEPPFKENLTDAKLLSLP